MKKIGLHCCYICSKGCRDQHQTYSQNYLEKFKPSNNSIDSFQRYSNWILCSTKKEISFQMATDSNFYIQDFSSFNIQAYFSVYHIFAKILCFLFFLFAGKIHIVFLNHCFMSSLQAEPTVQQTGRPGPNTQIRGRARKEVTFIPSIGFGTKWDEGLVFFTLFPFMIWPSLLSPRNHARPDSCWRYRVEE